MEPLSGYYLFNRLRYGYTKNQCRGKQRCEKCGAEHNVNECTSATVTCVHCRENHFSIDKQCREYSKQR